MGSGSGHPPPRRGCRAIMSHRGRRSQPCHRVLCPHRGGDRKIIRTRLTVRGAWRRRKPTAGCGPRAYRRRTRAARPTWQGPREGGTLPDAVNGQARDGCARIVVVAATPRPRSRVTAAGVVAARPASTALTRQRPRHGRPRGGERRWEEVQMDHACADTEGRAAACRRTRWW